MSGGETSRGIPALFATIHHRSDDRPNGYTDEEISALNLAANAHLPELHEQLSAEHRRRFGQADRMTGEVADGLKRLALNYAYPKARLVHGPGSGDTAEFRAVIADDPYPDFEREIAADMRSGEPSRVRIGLASVIFWGHFSAESSLPRAMRRAANVSKIEDGDLVREMGKVVALVNNGRLGQAMVSAFVFPEIGSTSFASKIIAFLAPERAGVFDQQIYEGLARLTCHGTQTPVEHWILASFGPWAWTAYGDPASGKKNYPRIVLGYERWCQGLAAAASDLNERAVEGPAGAWRAVDVERAIFGALRTGHHAKRNAP